VGQTPRPGSRRARGDRTRAVLVDTALRLFDARGVEATSVDEITSAAAVAKGTFYVHFQRKQDVLLEHAAQVILELDAGVLPGDGVEAIAVLEARVAEVMSATPRPLVGLMVREIVGHREDWLRILGDRPALRAIVQPLVERAQQQRRLRTDQTASQLAQALTILWLDGVIGWSEHPAERPLDPILGRATALFLDGVRPRRHGS
jgi:TetR/AcrR family transcriptional regulator, cholesterol catabolism regulator